MVTPEVFGRGYSFKYSAMKIYGSCWKESFLLYMNDLTFCGIKNHIPKFSHFSPEVILENLQISLSVNSKVNGCSLRIFKPYSRSN